MPNVSGAQRLALRHIRTLRETRNCVKSVSLAARSKRRTARNRCTIQTYPIAKYAPSKTAPPSQISDTVPNLTVSAAAVTRTPTACCSAGNVAAVSEIIRSAGIADAPCRRFQMFKCVGISIGSNGCTAATHQSTGNSLPQDQGSPRTQESNHCHLQDAPDRYLERFVQARALFCKRISGG